MCFCYKDISRYNLKRIKLGLPTSSELRQDNQDNSLALNCFRNDRHYFPKFYQLTRVSQRLGINGHQNVRNSHYRSNSSAKKEDGNTAAGSRNANNPYLNCNTLP